MRIFSSFADVSCSGLLRVRTNFSMTWEVAGEADSGDFVCLATGPTEIFEFFSMNSVISLLLGTRGLPYSFVSDKSLNHQAREESPGELGSLSGR